MQRLAFGSRRRFAIAWGGRLSGHRGSFSVEWVSVKAGHVPPHVLPTRQKRRESRTLSSASHRDIFACLSRKHMPEQRLTSERSLLSVC